jgi:hypothetical protein
MLKVRLIFCPLSLALLSAAASAQSGWSVKDQEARIKRENDAFYRHLPSNPQKKEAAINAFIRRPYAERILDGWSPAYESAATPKAFKAKSGVNVTGRWERRQGTLGAAFGITRLGRGYAVNFLTWDAKGNEVFRRSATLHGGLLALDRPVFDLVERPFSKVYVVKVGKEARLLPSADVAQLDAWASNPKLRARAIAGLTFRKR